MKRGFRKAYDTIARPFLYAAMDTVGVGPGFLALVRTLLTGTAARAYVNGWTSTPAPTAAGVRQGCPLAPLLYLFVAQALLRLLKARGIGIDVAGLRLTAPQYADDTEPLLPSLDQVPALLDALTTFGAASGQHLNPEKTLLLPLGAVPPDLPADAHGLRVVNTATALGVAFGSAADPAADWPQLVEGVERCFTRISNLPHAFSAFGRGFAASAYGVSKFLYHAEFTGQPPPQHLAHLTSITARLIDRRLPPAGGPPRFAGLAAWLLPGRPAEGGFGALPWPEHITSRHAWWAIRLITEPVSTPWVAVARALLRTCAAEVGSHPLGLLLWPADAPIPGRAALLPEPLRCLHTAVRCLPRVTDIAPQPLQPGPWCLAAPLWGNAFFASPDHPDSIDLAFSDVADIGIHTIGQLLSARAVVAAVMGSAAAYHPVWQTLLRPTRNTLTATTQLTGWRNWRRRCQLPGWRQRRWQQQRLRWDSCLHPRTTTRWRCCCPASAGSETPPAPSPSSTTPSAVAQTSLLPRRAAAAATSGCDHLQSNKVAPSRSCSTRWWLCGGCRGRTAAKSPTGGWCTTPSPPQCACTSPTPTASAAPPTQTPSITSASAHPLPPSWPPSPPPWLAPAPAPRLPPAPTCGWPARPPLCTLGRGRWCAWQPSQPWTVGGATCTLGCTARPSPLPTSLTLLLAPPALRWPASGSSLGTLLACAACLAAGAPPAPLATPLFPTTLDPTAGPSTGQQWAPPPRSSDCSPPGALRRHLTAPLPPPD